MDGYAIALVFAVLFGLAIGSFLNVLIHRIPLGSSIVTPRSSCPHCGTQIRICDNIPILSYLMLRGKCRTCQRLISPQYPIVEALTAGLSLALFIKFGPTLQYLLFFLFCAALEVISVIDLHHRIIPDILSLPGVLCGLAAALLLGHVSFISSLIGAIAGGGSLLVIAFSYERLTGRTGMGGGDIKLLAMIGAWLSAWSLPLVVLIASLSGILTGLVFIVTSGQGLRTRIPFGPFLSLGAVIYLFFGPLITRWYLDLLS